MFKTKTSPLLYFFGVIVIIMLAALFGPEEKSLGSNVRIVYLHGAWVLTAEIVFIASALAGVLGLLGLILERLGKSFVHATSALGLILERIKPYQAAFLDWCEALGRTGIIFWVTYLPLSLWAMESNWNGLFLAEPRFRLALTFAVVGILLQVGLLIIANKLLTAGANIAYIIVLRVVFASASNILHPPPSPIFNSGNYAIIGFFIGLNLLTWLAAYFLARGWLSFSPK